MSLPSPGDEDSDSWLNVDVTTFDSMLERSFNTNEESSDAMDIDKTSPESAEGRAAKMQAERLHSFAKKVEEFVEAEGDIQGARFDE